jgi:hypothetical protein
MAGELPRQFAVYPPGELCGLPTRQSKSVCGQVSEPIPMIHLEVRSPDATTTRSTATANIQWVYA